MAASATKQEEMVLAVRRSLLDKLGSFQGLNFDVPRYLSPLLSRENNLFIPRSLAETDPSYKQIIPYVLLTHEGRVLYYVRGKKGGEQRLTTKGSIGIGGHLNDGDENLFSYDQTAYLTGVRREVGEELILQSGYQNHIRALLNDDSTEVGRVHLGIVHVFELDSPQVTKRESVITQLAFLTPKELRERRDRLETWSQICLDALETILAGDPAVK
jgi:predicted NUDIX family phosphoesterase